MLRFIFSRIDSQSQGGDFFAYLGEDASWLNITIEGPVERTDPWLQAQDVLLLRLSYTPGGFEEGTWLFEEAVAVQTRSIVQQAALCDATTRDALDAPSRCDGSRVGFYFAGAGLPGGLGASPFWGRSVVAGTMEVSLRSVEEGLPSEATLRLAPARMDGRRCLAVDSPDPTVFRHVRALPWTIVGSPRTLCHGIPLPASFVEPFVASVHSGEAEPREFRLVEWRQGNPEDAVQFGGDSATMAKPNLPVLREPFYVTGNDAGLVLEPTEAHQQAYANSAEYKAMVDAGAIVATFDHYVSGASSTLDGQLETTSARASLTLVSPSGAALRVTVQEEARRLAKQPIPSSYAVSNPQPGPEHAGLVPNPRQLTLNDTFLLYQQVLGVAPPKEAVGFTMESSIKPTWSTHARSLHRSDGYDLYVQSPDPEAMASGSLTTYQPYWFVVDGATGALLWAQAPAEYYPF